MLAVGFLREYNMDTAAGLPSVVELVLNDNDTANLPPDYLQYRMIGICGADGKMHSLGRNNKLCLTDNCANPVNYQAGNIGDFGFASIDGFSESWRNGEFIGKMFGVNGGNNANGEFRIDLKNGLIRFGGLPKNTGSLVMEYIADIEAINDDFIVHPYIIQTLKEWVHWQSISFDRNRGIGEKEQAKANYFRESRWSTRRFQQFTVEEFAQAVRSGNVAAPKW